MFARYLETSYTRRISTYVFNLVKIHLSSLLLSPDRSIEVDSFSEVPLLCRHVTLYSFPPLFLLNSSSSFFFFTFVLSSLFLFILDRYTLQIAKLRKIRKCESPVHPLLYRCTFRPKVQVTYLFAKERKRDTSQSASYGSRANTCTPATPLRSTFVRTCDDFNDRARPTVPYEMTFFRQASKTRVETQIRQSKGGRSMLVSAQRFARRT